jgi:hypothetical protein
VKSYLVDFLLGIDNWIRQDANRLRRHAFVDQNLAAVFLFSDVVDACLRKFTRRTIGAGNPNVAGVAHPKDLGCFFGAGRHGSAQDHDDIGVRERIFTNQPPANTAKGDNRRRAERQRNNEENDSPTMARAASFGGDVGGVESIVRHGAFRQQCAVSRDCGQAFGPQKPFMGSP